MKQLRAIFNDMPRKLLAVIKRKMHILNMLFSAIFLIKKISVSLRFSPLLQIFKYCIIGQPTNPEN